MILEPVAMVIGFVVLAVGVAVFALVRRARRGRQPESRSGAAEDSRHRRAG